MKKNENSVDEKTVKENLAVAKMFLKVFRKNKEHFEVNEDDEKAEDLLKDLD